MPHPRVRAPATAVALAALALGSVAPACGDDGADGAAATTTTVAPDAFADAVRAGDLDAMAATLAERVELYGPVFAEPFVGRAQVERLLGVLLATFEDIEVHAEAEAPGRFVLHFGARIEDEPIEVVDVLTFDDDGRIEAFVVTTRPMAGTQALAAAVGPHLAEIGYAAP